MLAKAVADEKVYEKNDQIHEKRETQNEKLTYLIIIFLISWINKRNLL